MEGGCKRLGWIHTGSQTASFGSWGRDSNSCKHTRYELGITITPYLKEHSKSVIMILLNVWFL